MAKIPGNDYLNFEQNIAQIDTQILELESLAKSKGIDYSAEIRKLQQDQVAQLKQIYANLSPWQTVQVARHPKRPLLGDYLTNMVKDFKELHGDRTFGDDRAMICGFGQIGREKVMVIGHNKGRDTKEKITCNFGCANPEGYRKALAKMKLAEKFNIPVVTLIDTPGAYPGIGAEERGQAQAIAVNLMEMSRLRVPVICIVIGEGGSGGALGIGVGDKLSMLEFAYYSVISPEGCAAILWRDGTQAPAAAEALKLTSKDLFRLGLIDDIIREPLGGAHRNIHDTVFNVEQYVKKSLRELGRLSIDALVEKRYQKIRAIGSDMEKKTPPSPQPQRSNIKAITPAPAASTLIPAKA
ncbi:MAG: acetyl-CoA carboxylase carboxyltransferase subunit alpha [Planctomycetes bacterium GWF2_50_10]|nr:MAG: acetyl-CoA carboxylase carboxyltransferase subunit alpha [Planctomycetes bacterium GWF2_50_10]